MEIAEKIIHVSLPARRDTGIKDARGNKIYVGDRVMKAWGGSSCNGKSYTFLRWFTITEVRHQNVIRFNLGKIYNSWEGHEVGILKEDMIQWLIDNNMPEGENFCLTHEGKPYRPSMAQSMGITEEEAKDLQDDFDNKTVQSLWGRQV